MNAKRELSMVLNNRVRLNAGRIPGKELAFLMGVTYKSIECRARKMKISLKVKKEKP